jgi:hypothetical protein
VPCTRDAREHTIRGVAEVAAAPTVREVVVPVLGVRLEREKRLARVQLQKRKIEIRGENEQKKDKIEKN